MDGFDESTAEFKGFLTAMTKSLSENHKLLITTRPNTLEDLKGCLCEYKFKHIPCICKQTMTFLMLELLQDNNVEEIVQSLIIDNEKEDSFKTHFHSLDEIAKHLLRTPLNLNLYIELWKQDPELVRDTYTTKMLFLATIMNNLKILKQRLDGRTACSSRCLPRLIDNWFYGSLCKQSFLMLMQNRDNIISIAFIHILEDDAIKKFDRDPSIFLSTFLGQVEKNYWESDKEKVGEIEYKYVHLTQQYVLASLFLKELESYDGESVISSIRFNYNSYRPFTPLNLLPFYVEMIKEDGSLVEKFIQVFTPIQKMINHWTTTNYINIEQKSNLWISTSVASNFNAKYMEKVSLEFKDIPEFKIDRFIDLEDLAKFLKFVQPRNIVISDLLSITWKKDFLSLRDVLIKYEVEIELEVFNYDFYKTYLGEKENSTITDFNSYLTNTSFMKVSISKPVEEELWINFDSCWTHTDIDSYQFPNGCTDYCYKTSAGFVNWPPTDFFTKDNVENTILRLFKINTENFEKSLELLTKSRGDETLKFKAIYHDFVDLSEAGQLQLLEIAHTVSNDPNCELREFCLQQIVHCNVTAFRGIMDTLDLLKPHHTNLKNISLYIYSEEDFCRMFKFLHDNKTTLRVLWIKLTDRHFSDFTHWKRRSFFDDKRTSTSDFTFPRELLQHSTLYLFIGDINEENFQDFFALLNNVKGDETLKFKGCGYSKLDISPDKRKMLEQISYEFDCSYDNYYEPSLYLPTYKPDTPS